MPLHGRGVLASPLVYTLTGLPHTVATSGDDIPVGRRGAPVTAIVLAGGHRWRRSSLDAAGPRALLPVAGRPLVTHALEWLTHTLVAETVVCANGTSRELYEGLVACEHVGTVSFLDDVPPRGPAGCAADVAARCDTNVVLVVECSTIPTLNLADLVESHLASGAAATIVVQPPDPRGSRAVMRAVPAGIYLFNLSAFAHVPAFGFHDIKEGLLRRLYRAHERVATYEAPRWCPRVVDSTTYLQAALWAIEARCQRQGGAAVADGPVRIAPGALVVGPVLVEADAQVMDGAVIVGPAAIGPRTVVRANAVVSRAIVGCDCVIHDGALVDRAVVLDGMTVKPRARVVETIRHGHAPAVPRNRQRLTAAHRNHPAADNSGKTGD